MERHGGGGGSASASGGRTDGSGARPRCGAVLGGRHGEMWPPALLRLLAGPLLVLLVLLEAAPCGEAAAPRPRDAATASPRPTEAAGAAATRSSRSSSSSSRLAEVSPPEQGQPMTQRALSVLVLASAALIVYFVIRTVR